MSTERSSNPDWIPVEQELPPHEDRVLTINNFGCCEVRAYFNSDWFGANGGVEQNNRIMRKCLPNLKPGIITHWMPLPAPPEPEKDKES